MRWPFLVFYLSLTLLVLTVNNAASWNFNPFSSQVSVTESIMCWGRCMKRDLSGNCRRDFRCHRRSGWV